MALENVLDGIRAQARRESEAEILKARKEAAEILARARQQTEESSAKRARELEEASVTQKKRDLAAAELEARKLRLGAERQILADVRTQVEERLRSLPVERRALHIQTLAGRSGMRDGKLLVATRDRAAAERLGRPVGTIEGLGGVVVEDKDGSVREDLRYETLLDEVWQEHLREIATILFET